MGPDARLGLKPAQREVHAAEQPLVLLVQQIDPFSLLATAVAEAIAETGVHHLRA